MKKIIITESQLKKVIDRVLNEEDLTNYNFNNAVQLFLIKKKITDSNNQPIKKDGSIGRLPNSKSAQAIAKYQTIIGVEPDGVFGYDTTEKMKTKFPNDYKLWLECKSEEGDLFDKGAHFLGLDEQSTNVTRPTTQGPTNNSSAGSVPSLNGKTVNLYSDTQNGKFYSQVKINKVQKTNDGKIVLYLTNKGDMSITCTNPKKNEFRYLEPVSRKFVLVYNTPLATQLRKLMCTVNASGTPVPKADFASNTQKPTSDFA
jgi:hypothetical protein